MTLDFQRLVGKGGGGRQTYTKENGGLKIQIFFENVIYERPF